MLLTKAAPAAWQAAHALWASDVILPTYLRIQRACSKRYHFERNTLKIVRKYVGNVNRSTTYDSCR